MATASLVAKQPIAKSPFEPTTRKGKGFIEPKSDSVEKEKQGCENKEHLIAKQSNGHYLFEQTKRFAQANISKINNCIANSKKFYYKNNKTSTKGK